MSHQTTATLLPSVLKEQIDYVVDQLVELHLKFNEGELSLYEYNSQCEELWRTKEQLESQLANW